MQNPTTWLSSLFQDARKFFSSMNFYFNKNPYTKMN